MITRKLVDRLFSSDLIKNTAIVFLIKGIGAVSSLGVTLVVARRLGTDGTGLFFLGLTIATISAVFTRLGLENAVVKMLAECSSLNHQEASKQYLHIQRESLAIVLKMAIIIAVLLFIFSADISSFIFAKPDLSVPLTVFSLTLIPLTITTLLGHFFQGRKAFAHAAFTLNVATPLIFLILVSVIKSLDTVGEFAAAYFASSVSSMLIALLALRTKGKILTENRSSSIKSQLLSISLPLYAAGLYNFIVIWSPTIFLGMWATRGDVGIYSVSHRISLSISFLLLAVNVVAAPKYSELIAQFRMKQAIELNKKIATLFSLTLAPVTLGAIVYSDQVLSIFGPGYEQGRSILSLLVVSQYVSVGLGPVEYLLIMSDKQSFIRRAMAVSALSVALTSILFVPMLGAPGAALASLFAVLVQKLLVINYVKQHFGYWPTPSLSFIWSYFKRPV